MNQNPRQSRLPLLNWLHKVSLNRNAIRSLWVAILCISLILGFVSPVSAKVKKPAAKAKVVKPAVISVDVTKHAISAATAKNTIPVSIDITGKGFGKTVSTASVKVVLINVDSGEPTAASVTFASDSKIFAHAELPASDEALIRISVALEINGQSVDTTDNPHPIANDKPASPKPRGVEVDIKENNNPQNPTLHSVTITPKDNLDSFASDPTDPKAMRVQILPPGATNVVIDPVSTADRALITFTAPDGFKVQDVLVAVYDSSTTRGATETSPRRIATKPADSAVKITNVDVLSLQRRDGFGRLRIEGEGFGNHSRIDENGKALTTNGDLELLCEKQNRSYHVEEREDTNPRDTGKQYGDQDAKTSKEAPLASLCKDGDSKALDFKPLKEWRAKVEKSLNVQLVPRNPDLRVERTLIMYADDKVIDVYFEFSHWKDYSEPFRLDSVSVSVTKEQPASAPAASATARGAAAPTPTPRSTTFLASFPIGPPKDKNLEYRYTVLDFDDASELFGSGVGNNFYVLQLSVVNNSDKKLVVPLSSIQAEVEWSYAGDQPIGNRIIAYDEGPPTLSPLKLSAITSYFDTFQKTKGRKAKLFNVLDGVGTLAASLVPVFGRGIERGNSIMSGGLIPGLRKAFGDLSSQQLQNLTSMSWDSIEEIPAGGSKEKYVFIQRGDQVFRNKSFDNESKKEKVLEIHKQIKSLQGLEVSGFIVNDSRPAGAVPRP